MYFWIQEDEGVPPATGRRTRREINGKASANSDTSSNCSSTDQNQPEETVIGPTTRRAWNDWCSSSSNHSLSSNKNAKGSQSSRSSTDESDDGVSVQNGPLSKRGSGISNGADSPASSEVVSSYSSGNHSHAHNHVHNNVKVRLCNIDRSHLSNGDTIILTEERERTLEKKWEGEKSKVKNNSARTKCESSEKCKVVIPETPLDRSAEAESDPSALVDSEIRGGEGVTNHAQDEEGTSVADRRRTQRRAAANKPSIVDEPDPPVVVSYCKLKITSSNIT